MMLQEQIILNTARLQLIPEFVQYDALGFSSSSSWSFSIPAATEGNFMLICAGGSTQRLPTLAGWNHLPISITGVTLIMFWKFAGAGETTSITITWDGNIAGSMQYYEYINIDTLNPVISGFGTPVGFTAATSQSWGPYEANEPSLFVADVANNGSAASISIDNSFVTPTASGRHSSAVRVYPSPLLSQNTTWTFSSSSGQVGLVAFRGKII